MRFLFLAALAVAIPVAMSAVLAKGSSEVSQVLSAYRKAPAIRAKIKKTVIQEALDTEDLSSGDFYFSKGKMRIEIHEPDAVTMVYDGKVIWVESRFDEETVAVQKMKVGNIQKSDSVLAALLTNADILKKFNLKAREEAEGKKVFTFSPKDKKKAELTELTIALDGDNIDRIAYTDQLDNKVTFQFSSIGTGKVAAEKFRYTPPKGADVSEI